MKSSRGEIKIQDILESAGVPFQTEYSFPDLKSTSGRSLRFDFAVFDDNGELDFLIEFQGIQHYEPKSKFGGMRGLVRQKYNDSEKVRYCAQRDIRLIIIPYWDEGKVNYDYIFKAAGY